MGTAHHEPAHGDSPWRRRRRLAILGGAVAVLAVGGGLGIREALSRADRGRGPGFNVLLITLDTTRADHLGCYGHTGGATPNIDALAKAGTMFTNCTAAAPSTLPSHASILTGVYPYVHGARHNVGSRLSEANTTLAEVLRQAGYATGAHVAAFVVNRDTGLDQGFDTYSDTGMEHQRRGDEVCDGAIDWLRRHAGEKFFLWAHFFDPHFPYEPPEPWRSRFQDPYVGEIAFVDEQVGRLMAELRRLNLERKTLVVVTADHGEGLGEHGESTHLYFVYDTTMSVPLIFHCPGRIPAGAQVKVQVRNIDIAPTVLAFLDVPADRAMPDAQGQSLIAKVLGTGDDGDLPAYGESVGGRVVFGTSMLRCLRVDGWKYIHAPRPELYRVSQDPREEHDLANAEPDRVRALRDQLRAIVENSPPVAAADSTVRHDQAALDRLASLGYVQGAGIPASSAAGESFEPAGDDPKDHVQAFNEIGQATFLQQSGRYAEAEAIHRRLVERFPDSANLGMELARSVFLQGRFEEAIALYRGLLERNSADAQVHYGMGKLLGRVGRRGEAIAYFASAARIDPEYPEARYDLGVALLKEGRRDEAADCFREAVRIRPTYVDARLNLGVILAEAGRLDEAVEQYRQAIRTAPDDAVLHFNLGNALLGLGDRAAAVRAYDEALRLKPDLAEAREALRTIRLGEAGVEPARGEPPRGF